VVLVSKLFDGASITPHVHHVPITDSRKEEIMALGLNTMLTTISTNLKDKKLRRTNKHTQVARNFIRLHFS
jgi:hypothetical protein